MELEQIRIAEKNKRPLKGFLVYTFIQTTASQARSEMYTIPPDTFEKNFHPSWLRKGSLMLVSGFTTFWIFGFLIQVNTTPYGKLIIIPLIALVIFIIYDGFLNSGKIYDIHLDFEGVTIGEEFFKWSLIKQTAILQIGLGRGRKIYLVIVLSDGTYQKFNLQAFQSFWEFKNAIAAYIEYFKNKTNLT